MRTKTNLAFSLRSALLFISGLMLGWGGKGMVALCSGSDVQPKYTWSQPVVITGGFYAGQTGKVERLVPEDIGVLDLDSGDGRKQHYAPYGKWYFIDLDAHYRDVIVHEKNLKGVE